jgi:glycosyltransferase 2 family protein
VIDFRLSFVAEHRAMKRAVIMLFQLLVTAAGLWYVFHEPQRRAQIADALRHADIRWVLLGWICYSAVEILATVRWQILLRIQGICISWLRAGAIVIVGLFFNQFLPGGVGGDAMRLYFIFKQAPRKKIAATLSIAMDRLFGLLTVVFLAIVSFSLRFSWLAGPGPSRHIAYIAFILLSASLAFVLLLFWLVSSGLLHQLPKRTPLREAIIQSGEALLCYRTHVGAMAFVFPITVVAHLAYYTSFYCAGESLRLSTYDRASLGDILSIMPLVDTIISVPFSLGGIGVRETLFQELLGNLAHVPPALAAFLPPHSVLPSRLAGDWSALQYFCCHKKSSIAKGLGHRTGHAIHFHVGHRSVYGL